MSEIHLSLKWAHVASSTVLFGMGAGIAFFFIGLVVFYLMVVKPAI